MINKISHVIVISSVKSSANYAVAHAIVSGLYAECVIHHVYFTEDNSVCQNNDEYYYSYPVINRRAQWNRRIIESISCGLIKRIYQSLFYHTVNLFDNFFTSRIEREGIKTVQRIIRDNPIKSIVATNNPIYAQKILCQLTTKLPQISCIPLWLDPYLLRYKDYSLIWRISASRLERRLFRNSQYIYSLPETFKGDYNITYFKDKNFTFEIPFIRNVDVQTKTKRIIFAGSVVAGLREPDIPLQLFLQILPEIEEELCFVFYINNPQDYKEYEERSNKRIKIEPFIAREELEKELAECYMLINIGNINSIQMPSKVVEYISYRKPIIYFRFDASDPSVRYFDLYKDVCMINVFDDIKFSQSKLHSFLLAKHDRIEYDDLMSVPLFKRSTAQNVAEMIKHNLYGE